MVAAPGPPTETATQNINANRVRRSVAGIASSFLQPLRKLADSTLELARMRSEEHTSELQSRLHLVCRLLLEKKKKKEHNSQLVLAGIITNIMATNERIICV